MAKLVVQSRDVIGELGTLCPKLPSTTAVDRLILSKTDTTITSSTTSIQDFTATPSPYIKVATVLYAEDTTWFTTSSKTSIALNTTGYIIIVGGEFHPSKTYTVSLQPDAINASSVTVGSSTKLLVTLPPQSTAKTVTLRITCGVDNIDTSYPNAIRFA